MGVSVESLKMTPKYATIVGRLSTDAVWPTIPMMDMHSRNQYLLEVRRAYRNASKQAKGFLLDEAVKRTNLDRKYLMKKLKPYSNLDRSGASVRHRPVRYTHEVAASLVTVWELFDFPCGQRLEPTLKREVDRLRILRELVCSDAAAVKLKTMGSATIDRLLKHEKQVRHLSRHRNPRVHPLLYQKIPVKLSNEWDRNAVGNCQLDYVASCGQSASGEFINTLSLAEISTGWWEGQALMGRSQMATNQALSAIQSRLPFPLKEIHPDNDSGMINNLIWRFCQEHHVRFSRSRPLKKNDNCWVEQRNWSHVRKVVGYLRYDTAAELCALNALYRDSAVYKNFFQPTMKLILKERVGGRIKRKYDVPKTPYERLRELGHLDQRTEAQLADTYGSLNPAALKASIEKKRMALHRLYQEKMNTIKVEPMKKLIPRTVSSLLIQPVAVRCHG